MKRAVVVLAVVLLSGCQAPTDPNPPLPNDSDTGCIEDTCPPNTESADYWYAKQEFGVTQLNADPHEEFVPQIDGSIISWQAMKRENSTVLASDIIGFNMESGNVVDIGMGEGYHATRHFARDGRVAYTRQSTPGAPDYPSDQHLMLWNSTTGEKHRIEHGLEGDSLLSGFDGHWALFRQRYTQNGTQDGLWAYHVDDEQLFQIYKPPPNGTRLDGTVERLSGETVVDGIAYYVIRENTEVSTLFELDLLSRIRESIDGWVGSMSGLRADGRYLVWSIALSTTTAYTHVWAFNRETGETWQVSNHTKGTATFPGVGDDWVVYNLRQDEPDKWDGLAAYHLPSKKEFRLLENNRELTSQSGGTDGEVVVIKATRMWNRNFETVGHDLYWMPLPEIK